MAIYQRELGHLKTDLKIFARHLLDHLRTTARTMYNKDNDSYYCNKCNAVVLAKDNYCHNCGAFLYDIASNSDKGLTIWKRYVQQEINHFIYKGIEDSELKDALATLNMYQKRVNELIKEASKGGEGLSEEIFERPTKTGRAESDAGCGSIGNGANKLFCDREWQDKNNAI